MQNTALPDTPTHAGTVVFRHTPEGVFFLVIASSNGLHWVLPKGHIDPGETAEQAALRETAEEAGVTGEIISPLACQVFAAQGEDIAVQYYLMRQSGWTPAQEERNLRWEKHQEALALLTFENTRVALREGIQVLHDAGSFQKPPSENA